MKKLKLIKEYQKKILFADYEIEKARNAIRAVRRKNLLRDEYIARTADYATDLKVWNAKRQEYVQFIAAIEELDF